MPPAARPLPQTFLVLDFELAHADPRSVCALGAVAVVEGEIVWETEGLIRPPQRRLTFSEIHGLTWEDLKTAPPFKAVWPQLLPRLIPFKVWVAHNAAFERRVLRAACREWELARPNVTWLCTMSLAERQLGADCRALPAACRQLGLPLEHHNPLSDARAAAGIILKLRAGLAQ